MNSHYSKSRPLYTTFAWAYDRIVERPIKERAAQIHKLLLKHNVSSGSKILDAGCGPGLYTAEMGRFGYYITGVDLSREQIEAAKKRNRLTNVELFEDDIFTLDVINKYDVVFCRGVMNDILENNKRDMVFKAFNQYLKPGGLLLADVRDWERSKIQIKENPVKSVRFQTERGEVVVENEKILDLDDHQFTVIEKISLLQKEHRIDTEYRLKMKCWSEDELSSRLNNAGFSILSLFGDYNQSIAVTDSVYLVVLAEKISKT